MSRAVNLNEIIPGKLYQRGQFLTFPWEAKMKMLTEHNIGMVVNLWSRPDPELHTKEQLIYVHWPIAGNHTPPFARPMITMISDFIDEGGTVLVHCEAGVNRSLWLVTVLVAIQDLVSGPIALGKVLDKVGRAKIRSGLLEDIQGTHWGSE